MCKEILALLSLGFGAVLLLFVFNKRKNTELEYENKVLSDAIKREDSRIQQEEKIIASIKEKVEDGITDWEKTYKVSDDS